MYSTLTVINSIGGLVHLTTIIANQSRHCEARTVDARENLGGARSEKRGMRICPLYRWPMPPKAKKFGWTMNAVDFGWHCTSKKQHL